MSMAASSGNPPLEHDTAEAGHFQAITVRSQRARVGVGFAMHAVKCDKLPQICKQRGLLQHSIT
jgi:hypothetical protein